MAGGIIAVVGLLSIAVALVVLGLLSKRLGKVTRAPGYYRVFFAAAGLILVSLFVRFMDALNAHVPHADDPTAVILYLGLPAFALTISLIIAWRYWSWLLAERS